MITLYQLHWSHYVEKVRWALDFKGLAWSAVDVDPFTKHQLRQLRCQLTLDSGYKVYTVPTIHDQTTDTIVSDSSKILDYLEATYPAPTLYGSDPTEHDQVKQWVLWLDSTVGLAARRLAYTQIALEHPGIIAGLFIPAGVGAQGASSLKGRLAGALIAGVLSQRFRFLNNREDRVFEELEQRLLAAAERLSSRSYLVGERFTAADLTLAALTQPALSVPFFRNHPELRPLWAWRERLLQEHHRKPQAGYEIALDEVRRRRGWTLGRVGWLEGRRREPRRLSPAIPGLDPPSLDPPSLGPPSLEVPGLDPRRPQVPRLGVARNDQQPLGRWPLLSAPFRYLQLRSTCGLGRAAYPRGQS